jgi:sucrose-6-phosphate hydrolase SacC (GH32 family)
MVATLLTLALIRTDSGYSEPLRPQFHFTAKSGWLNDPNGLVYFGGEYHLFFQHNPFGLQSGNLSWGHAVSDDLIHWEQLDEAIKPDAFGMIWSGSAVVDTHHSSGLGSGKRPPMICFYTAAGGTNEESKGKPFTQRIVYSTDGRQFAKWEGNPVLPNYATQNRDPKVIWYEPGKHWVMTLFLDGNRYGIFTSNDLKKWVKTSDVDMPGSGECPDLFQLPVDGDKANTPWVFWSASGAYRLGQFDGKKFASLTRPIQSNFGNTGYAAQTYFNDPKGRRVQISWLNNSNFPGTAWNQQMGIPTELTLRSTPDGPRLAFNPVEEVKRIHRGKISPSRGSTHNYRSKTGLFDIDLLATASDTGQLKMTVNGTDIEFDQDTRTLKALGKVATIQPGHDVKLRILVDRASIEIFADGGLVSMPLFVLPASSERGFSWHVEGASDWKIKKFDVFGMSSAWD